MPSSSVTSVTAAPTRLAAGGLPRLVPPEPLGDLDSHLSWFGELPRDASSLITEVDRSGLRGRGGAGFPTAVKLAAVARSGRRTVVVANGTEGEPLSAKDKTLLTFAPHLVIDGAVIAAAAVNAREVIVCVDRNAVSVHRLVEAAIHQRRGPHRDTVPVRLEATPDRYLIGEESALVHWLNGGEAKPTLVPPRPFEQGVAGRPTLVQNVETLAHVALIARFGAGWFRAIGRETNPGSLLITVSGGVSRPGVLEAAFGTPLPAILEAAGAHADVEAVLVGGYFGTWLATETANTLTLDADALARAGASLGCGALFALPARSCGLAESARVARWLADQTAGQCGPCVHGLDAIATAMAVLVRGDRDGRAHQQLTRWLEMVKGRGACKLPDGAARFVHSSLSVFADEIDRHRARGPCRGTGALPLPATGPWR